MNSANILITCSQNKIYIFKFKNIRNNMFNALNYRV
nr:MAG TPA: hypothetical protein [Caudoviricetes sp.]